MVVLGLLVLDVDLTYDMGKGLGNRGETRKRLPVSEGDSVTLKKSGN